MFDLLENICGQKIGYRGRKKKKKRKKEKRKRNQPRYMNEEVDRSSFLLIRFAFKDKRSVFCKCLYIHLLGL
jgi:hypothetical protein